MSHKTLVSPELISIGIVINRVVQSGNYLNSHKYTSVINISFDLWAKVLKIQFCLKCPLQIWKVGGKHDAKRRKFEK